MKKSTIATFSILIGTLFWGMTFAFIKEAVSAISVLSFLFWRFGLAAILLGLMGMKQFPPSKETWKYGIILGALLGITIFFQGVGLAYTEASTAGFITGLTVFWVPLSLAFYHKKMPDLNVVLAVMLAFIGISLISFKQGFSFNPGNLWVLLCTYTFAAYIILAGSFTSKGSALMLTWVQFVTIAVLAGLIALLSNTLNVPDTLTVWGDILFCAIFASVISSYLQMKYQYHISATKTAIIFAFEPIFAAVTAYLYLNEQLDLLFIIGAVLVLIAIVLSELSLKKPAQLQD